MVRRSLGVMLVLAACLSLSPAAAFSQTIPAESESATDIPSEAATESGVPPDKAATKAAAAQAAKDKKQTEEAAAKAPDVGRMATLLAGVFALAAVIEAALAVIFAWPVFLEWINRRNSKMPISLIVSWAVAGGFDLRLIHKLAFAFGAGSGQALPPWFDSLLSALILAGGAAGVRGLMVALGLASPVADLEKAPRPPSHKAWLSVRDGRVPGDKSNELSILLGTRDTANQCLPPRLVGVIPKDTRALTGLARLFLTDRNRFPQVAGYPVEVGVTYDIYMVDRNTPLKIGSPWRNLTFGEGAIIDLVYRSGAAARDPLPPATIATTVAPAMPFDQ